MEKRFVNLLVGRNEELIIFEQMVTVVKKIVKNIDYVGYVEYSDGYYMDVYNSDDGFIGYEYCLE